MTKTEICSREEKEHALQRALSSQTFARSEQLKAFLRFICEAEVVRPGAPLTEYVIGVEVLGRHEGYSPAEDSSVRTRAYELRQKLERLYSTELPHEAIQITVPKGTYSPQYVRRTADIEIQDLRLDPSFGNGRPVSVTVAKPLGTPSWVQIAAVLAAIICTFVLTRITLRPGNAATAPDPVIVESWGSLARHDGTVVLCIATPLSLVLGPRDHDVYGTLSYPAPLEAYSLFRQHRALPPDGRLGMTFSDNMLGVGTMNAAIGAVNTLRSFGTSYQILPERIATTSSLRGRNAILFGAPVDSEAIALAMRDLPLMVDFEPSIKEFVIRDKSKGNFISPKKDAKGDLSEVYGLVTVKAARDPDQKPVQTILFSGITSVGTQGAQEFFSSPSTMSSLKSIFAKEGIHGFPAVYQVIVKCSDMNQLVLTAEYHSHRVIRRSL